MSQFFELQRIIAGILVCLFASGAQAAGLKDQPYAATSFNWSGGYAGANIGWAWGDADWTWEIPALTGDPEAGNSTSGLIGGGQIGFQQQFGKFVAGVEVSYSAMDAEDTFRTTAFGAIQRDMKADIDNLVLATVRLGYAEGRWLGFIKGGFASADVGLATERPAHRFFTHIVQTDSNGRENGWTIGGGMEYAMTKNIVIGLTYDYVKISVSDRSDVNVPFTIASNHENIDLELHAVTARVNYKF